MYVYVASKQVAGEFRELISEVTPQYRCKSGGVGIEDGLGLPMPKVGVAITWVAGAPERDLGRDGIAMRALT